MKSLFEAENRPFGLIIAILLAACIYFYYTNKQPWQLEAEQFVKHNMPIDSPRSRIDKIRPKNFVIRAPYPDKVSLYLLNSKMKNKLTGWKDGVGVDIYFGPDNKVKGYSSAYTVRIPRS